MLRFSPLSERTFVQVSAESLSDCGFSEMIRLVGLALGASISNRSIAGQLKISSSDASFVVKHINNAFPVAHRRCHQLIIERWFDAES